MDINEKKELLKEYYSKDFDLEALHKIIDFSDFQNREWGFSTLEGKFYRNISFREPDELKKFLIDQTPLHAYVGAIYDNPPSRDRPIHTLEWKGRELVFDIDLNDYDPVRKYVCSCKGADQVCNKCWQLVNVAIFIIDETLRVDFGFKKIIWVFSGRRGVHGWVSDPLAMTLDQQQRSAIINYLSVLQGDDEKARIQNRNKIDPEFVNRFESTVFRYFLKNVTKKALIDVGFTDYTAKNIIKHREHLNGKIDDHFIRDVNKRSFKAKNYDEIMRRWLPRIDKKVSIDLRRLLRMPNSIHGKTGKKASILTTKEILELNPEEVPSIFD